MGNAHLVAMEIFGTAMGVGTGFLLWEGGNYVLQLLCDKSHEITAVLVLFVIFFVALFSGFEAVVDRGLQLTLD